MSRWTADELYEYVKTLQFDSGSSPAPSVDGDKYYVHDQQVSQNVWSIAHNLNKRPSVTVVDDQGRIVVGDINYIDNNNLTISFNAYFSGKAYCN